MDFDDAAIAKVIQDIEELGLQDASKSEVSTILSYSEPLITRALAKIQSSDSTFLTHRQTFTQITTCNNTDNIGVSRFGMAKDGYQYGDDEIVNLIKIFLHKNPAIHGEILPAAIPVFDDVEQYRKVVNSLLTPPAMKILSDRGEQLEQMIMQVQQGNRVGMVFHTGIHYFAAICQIKDGELQLYVADTMQGVDQTKQAQIKALIEAIGLPQIITLYELFNPQVRDYDAKQAAPLTEEDLQKLSEEEQLEIAIEHNKKDLAFNATFGEQGYSSCGSYVVEYLKIMLSSSDYNQMNNKVAKLHEKSAMTIRYEHQLTLLEEQDNIDSAKIKDPTKLAEEFISYLKEHQIIEQNTRANVAKCKVAEHINDLIQNHENVSKSLQNVIGALYDISQNVEIKGYFDQFCKMHDIAVIGETGETGETGEGGS